VMQIFTYSFRNQNVKNGEGKKTELPRPELFQLVTHPEQSQREFLQLYDISLITERRNVFTPSVYVHNEVRTRHGPVLYLHRILLLSSYQVPVHQVMPSQQAQHFYESSTDYGQMVCHIALVTISGAHKIVCSSLHPLCCEEHLLIPTKQWG